MARARRATQLSLKLDVIAEEELDNIIENLKLVNCSPSQYYDASQPASTCTVTLRSSNPTSGNDPQFLHAGTWPHTSAINELRDHNLESLSDEHQRNVNVAVPLVDIDTDKPSSVGRVTTTWGAVTADQFSMAMDFWNPDENAYPFPSPAVARAAAEGAPHQQLYHTVTAAQQARFLHEILDEYLIRVQTVEHIDEIEDNDSAIEIVAILEGYRQNGWAEEVLKAFPCECWLFWCSSGIGPKTRPEDEKLGGVEILS